VRCNLSAVGRHYVSSSGLLAFVLNSYGTWVLIAVDAYCIRRPLDLPRLDADSFADSGQEQV
jgi:hypothetical protein